MDKIMTNTNYEHTQRGEGKIPAGHTALFKSDFLHDPFNYDTWNVLSEIADKIPSTCRDWGNLTESARQTANLEYAVNLGMLEHASQAHVELRKIEGSDNKYEFVSTACEMESMEIIRHFPMHFVTVDTEDEIFNVKSIELQEETEDYFLIKIEKDKDFP